MKFSEKPRRLDGFQQDGSIKNVRKLQMILFHVKLRIFGQMQT